MVCVGVHIPGVADGPGELTSAATLGGMGRSREASTTRRDTRNAQDVPGAALAERAVFGLAPFAWFRADSVEMTGSDVTAIRNRVGTDKLVKSAGTISAPAANASFGGQVALGFSSTQWYDSNLASTSWSFLHNGNGLDVLYVFAARSTATSIILANRLGTAPTQIGLDLVYSAANSVASDLDNGTATTSAFGGGATVANTPIYLSYSNGSARSPQVEIYRNGTSISTKSHTFTGTGSGFTLRVGAGTGGASPMNAYFADLIIFNRALSALERQQTWNYVRRRYLVA